MKVELVAYTPNPEETIERAARICYDSKTGDYEKRKKFLSGLIKSGHTSTIEHASATFKFSEVSRALTHELVRHRLFSFSQRSQRYCKEDGFGYVIPGSIKYNLTKREDENGDCDDTDSFDTKYVWFMEQIKALYNEMVAAGIPKEDARYILPNACYTEIFVSGNFREWRHFLELRLSPRAQWEIRQLAHMVLDELYKVAPIIFQDLIDKYEIEKDESRASENRKQ